MCRANENGTRCGLGGTCISGACICDSGWVKNQEFFFLKKADLNLTDPLKCNTHVLTLQILYTVMLFLAFGSSICYITSVKRKSQAKRLIPFWSMCSTVIILVSLKLFDDSLLFTVNIVVTLLLALSMFLLYLSLYVFQSKHIKYLNSTSKIRNKKTMKKVKTVDKVSRFTLLLALLFALTFILCVLLETISPLNLENFPENVSRGAMKREEIKRNLLTVGMTLAALSSIYQIFALMYSISYLKRDVRTIENIPGQHDSTITSLNMLLICFVCSQSINTILLLGGAFSDDL